MIEESLRQIGLTDGEIRAYIALLETGSTTTGTITKKSGISGSKTYEVLDRLIAKGLASSVERNGVLHFEAASPERLIDYLDDRQQRIESEKKALRKIIPELILRQHQARKSEVRVFTGFEGIKTANEDIIRTLGKGEEWLSMGLTEQPKAWEAYFTRRQQERAKKGIVHKHLLNVKYRSLYSQRRRLPRTEFRFLPRSFEMPTSTEIYGNKVCIMLLVQESPMAIVIESKEIAESFRKYFHALWKGARLP